MARNGSGTMSIPNTFVSGNTITASGHNQNWADAVSEITNSVAADGQTSMTGPLKAANGTAAAPTLTFASDVDTGMYRRAANELGFATGGVEAAYFNSSQGFIVTGAAQFGPGGTGTAAYRMIINGASGSGGGPYIEWHKNSVAKWQQGIVSASFGTSDDYYLFAVGSGVFALTISFSDNSALFGGKVKTPASTTARSGLNVPTGVAPTSPVDGDVWNDGTNLKVRIGSATQTLTAIPPTIQRFLSGSGTYTTAANAVWIRIRLVGGGAGGGGGNNSVSSTAGGASTFSGGTLSGGGGAAASAVIVTAAGGAASGGNVANIAGGMGGASSGVANAASGIGGSSAFGGAGGGSAGGSAGSAAAANSGSGGGGGGGNGTTSVPGGGGAGGYVEHIITSPAATYTYAVGAGGAGASGTGAGNGGAGAAGILIVEEYY